METVLIVEDEPAMLRGLQDNFAYEGYTVRTATDGREGLERALEPDLDLIILDIMLPKVNGYEICHSLRDEGIDTPVIMLTAKGEERDVVLGLNVGADDYVTKPFSIKELLARANALLRRRRKGEAVRLTCGPYELDTESRRLWHGGDAVPLTPKEFGVLAVLLERPGRAVSRDELLRRVWGYNVFVTPRSVDRCVATLRKKIEPAPARPRYVLTVREFGYRCEVNEGSA